MSGDDLYERFVEAYDGSGEAAIPAEWPEDVKKRCRFFVRMIEGDDDHGPRDASGREAVPPDAARTVIGQPSVLASLAADGIALPSSLEGAPGAPALPEKETGRYVVEREIGRGGMGRILLAYDRDFRRRVAVKVLAVEHADRSRVARFLEEAQATAQLEHPNIAPVYDVGVERPGAPFFTMKWIRGKNLHEIVKTGRADYSLIQLVQILQQAAMGVHFAHSRGVIHRDLKPQNVMVGDYGEVLVVDWGLAKVLGRPEAAEEVDPARLVSTERAAQGEASLEGAIRGSPAYMAPEQAAGASDAIDARTDVYGLGCILYEILTGGPPHAGATAKVALGQARRGEVEPPSRRARGRDVPRELDAICLKALAPRQQDRFQSAREFHDELQRYVEGIHDAERRAAEAARLEAAAREQRERLRNTEAAEARLRGEEEKAREAVADHEPEERKASLWEVVARREAARDNVARALQETTSAYNAVLRTDPSHAPAREALAELYFERLQAAEERGDREAASLYEGLVRQHPGTRFEGELDSGGFLRLTSDPPGAAVLLSRYEERGPLLVESAPEEIGATPIERQLPRGSYLARVVRAGFAEARLPFVIYRGERLDAAVRLPPPERVAPGFLFVPGGLTIVGSTARDLSSLPRNRVHVRDLCVGRFPVTLGEYCVYLNEEAPGESNDLREHIPLMHGEDYVAQDAQSRWTPIERLGPRVPAIALTVTAIFTYLRWLSRKLGREARLLEEVEWERCARGADGRLYPWGNGFDWAFTKGLRSRDAKPFPEPVGAFPRDESPFGLRDLAGGVREMCAGAVAQGYWPLRGGSWFNPYPFVFRTDCRTARAEDARPTDVGFRVCYDPWDEGSTAD